MRRTGVARLTLFALSLIAGAASAASVPLVTLDWPQTGQPMTIATVNGVKLPFRVALGFDSALMLNLQSAQAARLRAFPLIGKRTVRDPLIPGGQATLRGNFIGVALGGLPRRTLPTLWIDKPVATDADGIVSALAFDADRILLSRPGPAGSQFVLNRDGRNSSASETVIAGTKVLVRLDLVSPDTVMSSGAADALVRAGLARRAGRVALWRPFPDIRLPVERLTPTAGARLLGLPLVLPTARISEAEMKRLDSAAKAGTSTADDDADTIVVTGSRKPPGRSWIIIGRDVLDQCTAIELDRPAKVWRLTCNFTGYQ